MLPDTQWSCRSGLPAWTRDVNQLDFYAENGELCPPGDRPQRMGNRSAMWNGSPFTPPFSLKADLDEEAIDAVLARQIWRPGERREWDPGTPLPEVQ